MICIPITSATNRQALHAVQHGCRAADCLELRMDLIKGGNLRGLMDTARRFAPRVKIIVTCRKKEEALAARKTPKIGRQKTKKEKLNILQEAVKLGADFIDIELAEGKKAINQLKNLCARHGSKTKIIVSYHDIKGTPSLKRLKEIYQRCAQEKPAVIKIVTFANKQEDNLRVLALIPHARQRAQNIIALCMGQKGLISRIAGPALGNYLGFAALTPQGKSAPGQLTVADMNLLKKIFGEKKVATTAKLPATVPQNFLLLGNPVAHSLSPLMHNAALKEMGMNDTYSACGVQDLSEALRAMKAMNIRGASVTIPFKVEVMQHLDEIKDDALEIGAVNTIINDKGKLTGANTDWLGIVTAIGETTPIKGKAFVIVGAGGTARAAVHGIRKEGGLPVLVNRTASKAKTIARQFGCPFYSLAEIAKIQADCLINTTSVGMYPGIESSPVPEKVLKNYKYVMDVIYNPLQTKLLKDAAARGCRVISGVDMFIHQGAAQLKLWTKKEPPVGLMKKIVLERLTAIEQQ
ncbi:MAG TPA: shikimate dehydrogenase [Smithellaceae bacterium]|nr:shikimate dehydrogenase [Smithellaceae bacterium]HRS88888.1 shikimate dehydrogenase [Smithellaceae bacterium]HRV26227.1 shikimate dehydrogenase [Smithellaceae bacterium]